MSETVTSADGTTIAYDRVGDGPAVILVGGAIQHRAIDSATADLAALLAPEFTVYHYDRRGRGDSGEGATRYTIEREIEDIAALMAAAGGSAALFGMSSGAALALDAAARRPAVTKVAVYEAPFAVDGDPITSDDYLPPLHALLANGDRAGALEWFFTEAVGLPPEAVAGMRQSPAWPALEQIAPTLAYDGALLEGTVEGKPLPEQRWAAVSVPVLVLDGGASPPSMASAAEALVSVLSDARRQTLPGQTHQVDPQVLAPVLLEFYR